VNEDKAKIEFLEWLCDDMERLLKMQKEYIEVQKDLGWGAAVGTIVMLIGAFFI